MDTVGGIREQLCPGLVKVFNFLVNKTAHIPDDSILHILVDLVKTYLDTDESVLEAGVVVFLEQVATLLDTLDGSIVTFALQLAGWLGTTQTTFVQFGSQLKVFFKDVRRKAVLLDNVNVSVVTSFYNNLAKITGHKAGLTWVIELETAEFCSRTQSLLKTGSSIFMDKAIVEYQSSVLVSAQRLVDSQPDLDIYINQKLGYSVTSIHTMVDKIADSTCVQTRQPDLCSCLRLVERLCSCPALTHRLMTRTQLIDDVIKIVMAMNGTKAQLAIKILNSFLSNGMPEKQEEKIVGLVNYLLKTGDIKKVQKVAGICGTTCRPLLKDLGLTSLSQPIKFILGNSDYPIEKVETDMLKSNMASKSGCTSLLCSSISGLSKTKMNMCDDIALLFSLTLTPCSDIERGEVTHHVYNNTRLQHSCIQYLLAFTDTDEWTKHGDSISRSVVHLMGQSDIDSTVYTSCVQLLHPLLPGLFHSTNTATNTPTLVNELALTLQRHMCAIHWELRDTTLELLTKVLDSYKDNASITAWLIDHRLPVSIWQCICDGESYVRATAITALSHLLQSTTLLVSLQSELQITEDIVVGRVLNILETDSEAFPRRSAVTFLQDYIMSKVKTGSSDIEWSRILATLVKGTLDFDWMVKCQVLNTLDMYIETTLTETTNEVKIPDYAKQLFDNGHDGNLNKSKTGFAPALAKVYKDGCLGAVVKSLGDYDQKVCEKACTIVGKLKLTFVSSLHEQCLETVVDRVAELVTADQNDEHSPTKRVKLNDTHELNVGGVNNTNVANTDCLDKTKDEIQNNIKQILDFDISVYRCRFENASDYTDNPMSLIQDILSYADKPEDDNVVDCY